MAIELEQFARAARSLELETFRERYGDAFLVRAAGEGVMLSPDLLDHDEPTTPGGRITAIMGMEQLRMDEDVGEVLVRRYVQGESFVAYMVKRRRKNAEGTEIVVGRTPSSDVRIEDMSVSKKHAVFHRTGQDEYTLTDLGSRNGSAIAERVLDAHAAQPVRPGQKLAFGKIELMFLNTALFVEFVKKNT